VPPVLGSSIKFSRLPLCN